MELSVRMSQRRSFGSAALESSTMRLQRNAIMLREGRAPTCGARVRLLLDANRMFKHRKSEKFGGKSWMRPSLTSSTVALRMLATASGGSCMSPLMRTRCASAASPSSSCCSENSPGM